MAKTLRADIVIGGRADGSLFALGSTLQALGAQIAGISNGLINFGKESVEAYASYEDYMLDAEVALRTQYDSTSELGKVMEQLDAAGLQWASNSRFTTRDVAQGISEAAHAGWDLLQIMNGVPEAIDVSLAGGMELAQGLQYLIDVSNAAEVEAEDLGQLVDYWAYAANRSSTTIPEMGEAMQKMGATMQFAKGDVAGLVTMLAVLADNGTKGTEAGTLLRNSIIRVIAPTQKAAEAMADLDLTMDELDEIYGDSEGLEAAVETLKEAGFSAYDAQGRLKPLISIWEELDEATRGMTEQERNQVLSAIFPTRTITGALALLEAARDDWNGLYESIRQNGEGYAEYAAEKMESGLGGSLRHLESVYDALKTRTGSELAEPVSTVADGLSGLIESVNGMDSAAFQGLISGLGVIAGAGPALMTVGGGMRLLGMILGTGWAGKAILGGIGLTALAAGMAKYNAETQEQEYIDSFGTLALDAARMEDYVASLDQGLSAAQSRIEEYNAAVEQSVQEYADTTGKVKSILTTAMLTGGDLAAGEIRTVKSLGSQVGESLLAAIEESYSASELSAALFKDGAVDAGGEDLWDGILDTMEYGHDAAVEEARRLGQEIKDAITGALSDGKIDAGELLGIQDALDEANRLMAEEAMADAEAEKAWALHQAQTLGLDSIGEMTELVTGARDSALAALEENHKAAYTDLYKSGMKAVNAGLMTMEQLYAQLAGLDQGFAAQGIAERADADKALLGLFEQAAMESGISDSWSAMKGLARNYNADGFLSPEAQKTLLSLSGDRDALSRHIGDMVNAFGGAAELKELAAAYTASGDMETASKLKTLDGMNTLAYLLTAASQPDLAGGNDAVWLGAASKWADKWVQNGGSAQNAAFGSIPPETYAAMLGGADQMPMTITPEVGQMWAENLRNGITSAAGKILSGWGEFASKMTPEAYGSMVGFGAGAGLSVPITPVMNEADFGNVTVPVDVQPRQDGEGLAALESQEVNVQVTGDTAMLTAAIQAEDGKTLTELVNGDASALGAAISAYDGRTVTVTVVYNSVGGPSLAGGTIHASGGGAAHGGGGGRFAEGGRATVASIFGEAGPEWAIPEEHTERTASLLDAARAASGFTWPELISRNGGLNAGSERNWTLVYKPTIVAGNAEGVEQKLIEDKKRLENWMKSTKLHDDMEVYA